MAKKETEVRPVTSILGTPVKVFYGPDDLPDFDYKEQLNDPGEFPFTRGVYPTMYRSAMWTMRQYSGQSTPESTNERFKYLLKNGQTGLSLAFDLPTQIGLDSDMSLAEDDVGKLGVAVDTLDDFERIYDGHLPGRDLHVFHDQRDGADHPGHVCPGGPEAGRRDQETPRYDPE